MYKEALARDLLFVWEFASRCRNLWLGSQDGPLKARGPISPEIQRSAIGEKHAGKILLWKVGAGPSSETDTITGQQGGSGSVGWIFCLSLGAFKLTKINPFDWLCLLILKISSEHLPVFSAYQNYEFCHHWPFQSSLFTCPLGSSSLLLPSPWKFMSKCLRLLGI